MAQDIFLSEPSYIRHPLIKPDTVEQRLYQLDLAGKALAGPSLVVLPTGLGKTIIALFVIASRLQQFGGKALLLSPTKPLVEQHAAFLKKVMALPEEEILTFTGSVSPVIREELWEKGKVIVSTPQVIENDLLTKRISLKDVSHITFDEAHRAVGNYAYTYIAEKYFETAATPHVLAITASPGSTDEKIAEVCAALHIETVAVKTEKDRDVRPYVQEKEIEWAKVDLPAEMAEIRELFERIMDDRLSKIDELGFSAGPRKYVSKKDLLSLQQKLQAELRGGPDPAVFSALSIAAEVMKLNHAVELIETQGAEALRKYLEKLEHEASSRSATKAAKRLMEDLYMRKALARLKECEVEHPKLGLTRKIVAEELFENPDSRAIVFTNYRDTAEMVAVALSEVEGISPIRFVGQSSRYRDRGLTQKQQVEIIERFKAGEYNVLVATSVAEEGLDIPATDLVLFYEPIPSEIRSIQRKGRTGRQHKGRVVVLITKGTRDEAYYWSSKQKEKRMLNSMQGLEGAPRQTKGAELSDFETIPKKLPKAILESGASAGHEQLSHEQLSREQLLTSSSDLPGSSVPNSALTAANHAPTESLPVFELSENLKPTIDPQKEKQKTLLEFNSDSEENSGTVKVVIDHRETKSGVAKSLEKLGVNIKVIALEVGDYVLSDRVAVERKRVDDFASSLIDGKRNLFAQLSDLARVYSKPVLVLEGEDVFACRQINPSSIYGSLASIAIDFGVSILHTRDEKETASLLKAIAKREQSENKREVNPHGKKSASTLAEQQEYLVSSITNIGPKAARNLLMHFGTVEAVMKADVEELQKVKLIGPKTAARIREIVETPYKG